MDDVISTIVTFSLQKFIGCNGALSCKVLRPRLLFKTPPPMGTDFAVYVYIVLLNQ